MLSLLLCVGVAASSAFAGYEFTDGLAIGRVGATGRNTLPTDVIVASLVDGSFRPPVEGRKVQTSRGQSEWTPVKAGPEGFEQRRFQGGYLYCEYTADKAGPAILHANGHSMAYANREPRGGDVYGYGYMRLPVWLKRGRNEFLFQSGRGGLTAKLVPIEAVMQLDASDLTLPDLRIGNSETLWGAIKVLNNTKETAAKLALSCFVGGNRVTTPIPVVPGISVRKVPFQIPVPKDLAAGSLNAELRLLNGKTEVHRTTIDLTVVEPLKMYRQTFFSDIDGSLQYFAVQPSQKPGPDNALVLSVHGASVEATSQARAYKTKDWLTLVAATNRRPYGFDWEDWGRLDALEVLRIAKQKFEHDPARVLLTGHSMGGHGTWHIGLTHPDLFGAIGPAAGWISFFSYAGMNRPEEDDDVSRVLSAATNPSDTLSLLRNSLHYGVYILHGDKDESVPVTEARRMNELLKPFHPDLVYCEVPGGSHWWGDDAVDWPALFDFFKAKRLRNPSEVDRVEFVTANPGVSSRSNWVEILQQESPLGFSKVGLYRSGNEVRGTTENVKTLSLDLSYLGSGVVRADIDGQKVEFGGASKRVVLVRLDGIWGIGGISKVEKQPSRHGPFKLAFQRRMAFVYGTGGSRAENAWSFAKARYDAEQWLYRGNGAVDVMADHQAVGKAVAGRNLVLYGNSTTNTAIPRFVSKAGVQVDAGTLAVGDKPFVGEGLGCLFVSPKTGDPEGLVAVVGGTDLKGMRSTDRMPYLSPAVGYPDWIVFRADVWTEGSSSVVGAGFLGNDWLPKSGVSAWR